MTKRNTPKRPPYFRLAQSVSPVPSARKFAKTKGDKNSYDIYVTDIDTGDETLAMTLIADTHREAVQLARKRLFASPALRKITNAAFTAVEVKKSK